MGMSVELVTPRPSCMDFSQVAFSYGRFDEVRDLMRYLSERAKVVNKEAVLGLVTIMQPHTVLSSAAFKDCLSDLDTMLRLEFERILYEVDREDYEEYLTDRKIFDLIEYETRSVKNKVQDRINNEIRNYSAFYRIVELFKEAVELNTDIKFC